MNKTILTIIITILLSTIAQASINDQINPYGQPQQQILEYTIEQQDPNIEVTIDTIQYLGKTTINQTFYSIITNTNTTAEITVPEYKITFSTWRKYNTSNPPPELIGKNMSKVPIKEKKDKTEKKLGEFDGTPLMLTEDHLLTMETTKKEVRYGYNTTIINYTLYEPLTNNTINDVYIYDPSYDNLDYTTWYNDSTTSWWLAGNDTAVDSSIDLIKANAQYVTIPQTQIASGIGSANAFTFEQWVKWGGRWKQY